MLDIDILRYEALKARLVIYIYHMGGGWRAKCIKVLYI